MLEPEGGTVVAEKREAPHGSVNKRVSAIGRGGREIGDSILLRQ